MGISLIVAMDKHRLIGNENGLPWHLPADLKRFRRLTTGKPIIMGRRTFEHIGKPLPHRFNIVVTRQTGYTANGCAIVRSVEEAHATARTALEKLGGDEIMVIGGAEIFRQVMSVVERVYLTIVYGHFTGNAYFPKEPPFRGDLIKQQWLPVDEKNSFPHRFLILETNAQGRSIDDVIDSGAEL